MVGPNMESYSESLGPIRPHYVFRFLLHEDRDWASSQNIVF